MNKTSLTSNISPVSRFSNRAENYARYRPGYPAAIFPFLEKVVELRPETKIADLGSGTGLFAEPLLERGYSVACIEPNDDMRRAGEERLRKYPSFTSIGSTAEATGLPEKSIDIITAAQAFHWLNPVATRLECTRILHPHGFVVLAWNRQRKITAFEKSYTALRERYRIGEPGPVQIDPQQIKSFFASGNYRSELFPNEQLLNFDALKGQLLSKSYSPLPGHPSYEAMISELIQLFVANNKNGLVRIEYETWLYWGRVE